MARKKRRLKPWHIAAAVLLVAFGVFANLCVKGQLPGVLQTPVSSLNQATGGLLYSSAAAQTNGLTVRYIDVGQGDSILITCGGESMLIDGGPNSSDGKSEQVIQKSGVKELSYLVSTHPDEDHAGGLATVLGATKTDNVLMTDATASTQTYKKFLAAVQKSGARTIRAKAGQNYSLGGAAFTVLAPLKEYDDTNDMSVVLKLTYKNRTFLFTGDAAKTSEADMLKTEKASLAADVLKVGHHGSDSSSSQAFLNAVKPQYAVISVGLNNTYGLPKADTLAKLKKIGATVLRTDQSGTVTITSDGSGLSVSAEK